MDEIRDTRLSEGRRSAVVSEKKRGLKEASEGLHVG